MPYAVKTFQNIDIIGKYQHGFKKDRSTLTLSFQLQSIIARSLDKDNYIVTASLDLSAAFDVVNIELLLKRLRVLGLPDEVVALIKIWLKNRLFYLYVQVSNHYTNFIEINSGTILGPIFYLRLVVPLY